jgi:ABC-type transporter Mla MlaB component
VTKRKKNTVTGDDPVKPKKKRQSKAGASGKPVVIRLAASLTVNEIKSTYKKLLKYQKGNGNLSIDASDVQAIDTAGIQVLLAFTREIRKQERLVEWQSPSSELIQLAELLDIKELGF